MKLTDRDRKILWAKSGNRCSYKFQDKVCNQPLSENDQGNNVVLGEECHIVGEKSTAARYIADFPHRETYENAILLCSPHHKLIDDKETRDKYTTEILMQMKKSHEQAVEAARDALSSGRIEIKNSEFRMNVNNADRAVGMEVNTPASLFNVKAELKATNVREAVVFCTNQALTGMIASCSECRKDFPAAFTGVPPASVNCPHCGHVHQL